MGLSTVDRTCGQEVSRPHNILPHPSPAQHPRPLAWPPTDVQWRSCRSPSGTSPVPASCWRPWRSRRSQPDCDDGRSRSSVPRCPHLCPSPPPHADTWSWPSTASDLDVWYTDASSASILYTTASR